MGTGRISLLVDSPLRDMLIALRGVPAEARAQVTKQTRAAAEPIWFEEIRGRAETRLQQRTLVDSSRVGVATRNIYLRSGAVGRLSSGTDVSRIANPGEFGANPGKQISQRAKGGKVYTRKLGNAFGPPRRGGYAFYPAVKDAIPRVTSVAIQTCRRALFDALDGGR